MNWRLWIRIIGLVLLFGILCSIQWAEVAKVVFSLKPNCLIAYVIFFILMLLVRAGRLQLALAKINYSLNYRNCFFATVEPSLMGIVTPGRIGEFTKVGHLRDQGVASSEAISLVIIERFIDLWVLMILGVAGLFAVFAGSSGFVLAGLVVLCGLLVAAFSIVNYESCINFLKRHGGVLARHEPSSWKGYRRTLASSFGKVLTRSGAAFLTGGIISAVLSLCQIHFLAKAFAFQIDSPKILFAYLASSLVATLPISFGGLGTREATYISIMGRAGITPAQAVTFSLIDGVVFSCLIPLLLLILNYGFKLSSKK